MAGQPQRRARRIEAETGRRPVVKTKVNAATRAKQKANSKLYWELMEEASRAKVKAVNGMNAADVLQELLDRAVGNWRWAASELDKVAGEDFWFLKRDAQMNVVHEPHKWYKLERAAAAELERLCNVIANLGFTERIVRVEEAKAAMIATAVREACVEAGADGDMIRKIGAALRDRLTADEPSTPAIEGRAA